jgi:hypothetical protein
MHCDLIRLQLDDYILGESPPEWVQAIKGHIKTCSACSWTVLTMRRYFEERGSLDGLGLANSPAEPCLTWNRELQDYICIGPNRQMSAALCTHLEGCVMCRKVFDGFLSGSEASTPAELFVETLYHFESHYFGRRFFKERDVVWTFQQTLEDYVSPRFRVFNDFPILSGRRRILTADLAVVDNANRVRVAAEFKYEPNHSRAADGGDLWPDRFSPTVVSWDGDGVLEDIDRITRYVTEGGADVAFGVFIDEGGYFRERTTPPGSDWVVWQTDFPEDARAHVLLTRRP